MLTTLDRLPDPLHGLLFIAAGVIVVLYALGLIKTGINFLVISFGVYLIVNGIFKSGLYKKIFHRSH